MKECIIHMLLNSYVKQILLNSLNLCLQEERKLATFEQLLKVSNAEREVHETTILVYCRLIYLCCCLLLSLMQYQLFVIYLHILLFQAGNDFYKRKQVTRAVSKYMKVKHQTSCLQCSDCLVTAFYSCQ